MKDELVRLIERASDSERVRKVVHVARIAVQTGPVREIAAICGRAGVAGAIVDGGMGGVQAVNALRQGKIDGKQAAIHVGAETGCGFVTSASGTAGTLGIYMLTGSMGPVALAAGMGASMGSRWLYRKAVGDTLPGDDSNEEAENLRNHDDSPVDFEPIGPTEG